ncbi:MAG: hypothetical protein ACRCXB_22090 [Aeromonadaceae bacterium]
MVTWILVYHLAWDAGFSWTKDQEEYQTKQDCMEQVEVMRENAKANKLRVLMLYCKPSKVE